MRIEFEQPLSLALEVIETDEHVPSMRVNVQTVVMQFQNTSKYEGTFWIECTTWDSFVKSLHGLIEEAVVLRDISGCFVITLQKIDGCLMFTWEFAKTDVGGNRQVKITFTSAIDDDVLSKIRNEFFEFPAWW
jgi:hypothetical protein